jgi:ribosome-associated toxin RatA of RatAB toxin-antitoxin module
MPTVEIKHDSPHPADVVWASLIDILAYPNYLDDIRTVEILSQDGDTRVSRWTVLLKGSEMTWTEEETLNHEDLVLEFVQTEGDLADYRGRYVLTPLDGATHVEMYVEFDIGIPELAEMLNPVAEKALEESLRATLDYVARRGDEVAAAATAPES